MEHPDRVSELVLRGIFLVRKIELDWLYQVLYNDITILCVYVYIYIALKVLYSHT